MCINTLIYIAHTNDIQGKALNKRKYKTNTGRWKIEFELIHLFRFTNMAQENNMEPENKLISYYFRICFRYQTSVTDVVNTEIVHLMIPHIFQRLSSGDTLQIC